MSNLDLNINNYNYNDIEIFFKLTNKKYSESDVELKEYEIREQLLSSGAINARFKKDLIDFLEKAKQLLIFTKFGRNTIQPSEIPKNYQLDSINYPISKKTISRENELIRHKDASFVNSNNSEFYAGTLNPLNTRIISKCLTIDTRFRDELYCTMASDFTIALPTRLNKVVSMQLASIELPIHFYEISANFGNHYLYIAAAQQFFPDGEIKDYETIIFIPDGNYTPVQLLSTINSLLCPRECNGEMLNPETVFSYIHFILNEIDGKAVVEPYGICGPTIYSITLDFTKNEIGCPDSTSITTRIGWNLGFIHKIYKNDIIYTSDSIVDTKLMRYVYLGIDDYQKSANNLFLTAFHKSTFNENILARIALNSKSFTVLMENNLNLVTLPRNYFGPVDIQKLRVQLFDDYGRILNINHSNFSFVLNFKMLYDL